MERFYVIGETKRFVIRVIFLVSISILLTSCLEVRQRIVVNKNGSGNSRVEIALLKEMLPPSAVPELKNELKSKGWSILRKAEKGGQYVITAGRKFKSLSELSDDEERYRFSSKKKGFMKRSYLIEVEQLKNSDLPFPYELTIEVPGRIDKTNGSKVSSHEVKWNLQGLSMGTKLYVGFTASTIPFLKLLALAILFLLLLFVGVVIIKKMTKPGTPKSIFCTQCGAENPISASFCANCGHRLDE